MWRSPITGNECYLNVLNLSLPTLATQLPDCLRNMSHPHQVALRKQTARRVGWEFTPQFKSSFLNERAALPRFTEAIGFKLYNDKDCKTIVELSDVNIFTSYASHI